MIEHGLVDRYSTRASQSIADCENKIRETFQSYKANGIWWELMDDVVDDQPDVNYRRMQRLWYDVWYPGNRDFQL